MTEQSAVPKGRLEAAEWEKRRLGYREPAGLAPFEVGGLRCYQWFDGRDNLATFYEAEGEWWQQVPAFATPLEFRLGAIAHFGSPWIDRATGWGGPSPEARQ